MRVHSGIHVSMPLAMLLPVLSFAHAQMAV